MEWPQGLVLSFTQRQVPWATRVLRVRLRTGVEGLCDKGRDTGIKDRPKLGELPKSEF